MEYWLNREQISELQPIYELYSDIIFFTACVSKIVGPLWDLYLPMHPLTKVMTKWENIIFVFKNYEFNFYEHYLGQFYYIIIHKSEVMLVKVILLLKSFIKNGSILTLVALSVTNGE